MKSAFDLLPVSTTRKPTAPERSIPSITRLSPAWTCPLNLPPIIPIEGQQKSSIAAETGLSKSTVQRVWQAFGIQPHRQKHFKLSTDPFLVEKVRAIVGLYLNPPHDALVLCVDEKSQIQALDRTQPMVPMGLGYVEGLTHDYGGGEMSCDIKCELF